MPPITHNHTRDRSTDSSQHVRSTPRQRGWCGVRPEAMRTLIARSNTQPGALLLAAGEHAAPGAGATSLPRGAAVGVVARPTIVFRRGTVARTTWMRLAHPQLQMRARGADQSHAGHLEAVCNLLFVGALQNVFEDPEAARDAPGDRAGARRHSGKSMCPGTRRGCRTVLAELYGTPCSTDSNKLDHCQIRRQSGRRPYPRVPGSRGPYRYRSTALACPDADAAYGRTLTWYSWFAKQFDRGAVGWSWLGLNVVVKMCRNSTWAAARRNGGQPVQAVGWISTLLRAAILVCLSVLLLPSPCAA